MENITGVVDVRMSRPMAVAFPAAGVMGVPPISTHVRGELCLLPGGIGQPFATGARFGATDARTTDTPVSGPPAAGPPV